MSVLSSLLARDQVVAVKKIEEAIQRQVISGGELPTVLLEVGAAEENVIAAYHAASVELVPVSRLDVMSADVDVIRVLPRPLAERFLASPVAIEANTIVIAAANALPAVALDAIREATGRAVEVRIATEPRIASALQQHYGIAPIARMRRLIARLESLDPGAIPEIASVVENRRNSLTPLGTAPPSGATAWLRATTAGASGTTSGSNVRGGTANARTSIAPVSSVEGTDPSEPPKAAAPVAVDAAPAPVKQASVVSVGVVRVVGVGGSNSRATDYARAPKTAEEPVAKANVEKTEVAKVSERAPAPIDASAPMDAETAIAALSVASDRHAILTAAFAHIRSYFAYCAVFATHEDTAEGLDAYGDGASAESVRGITVDLGRPGTARDVRQFLGAKAGALDATDADRELANQLERVTKQPSVIFPIAIRQRAVFLFYGDRAGKPLGVGDLGDLIAFLPRVSDALQRLILQKKRRSDRTSASPMLKSGASAPWSKGGESDTSARDSSPDGFRDSSPDPEPAAAVVEAAPAAAESVVSGAPPEPVSAASPIASVPAAVEPAPEPSVIEASLAPASEPAAVESAPEQDALSAQPFVAEAAPIPSPSIESDRSRHFDVLGVPRRAPEPPSLDPVVLPAPAPVPAEAAAPVRSFDRGRSIPPGDTTYRGVGTSVEEEVVLTRRKSRSSIRPSSRPAAGQSPAVESVVPKSAPIPAEAAALVASAAYDDEDDDEDEPEISVTDGSLPPPPNATIITDLGLDLDDLVDDLIHATRDDVDPHVEKLVGFGEPALRVLVRRFPGPLWIDARPAAEGPHPRARDVGPILNAIVAFRGLAVAHVAHLLDQREAELRYYAALLAAEVTHRDLVVRVGRRVLDDDASVRAAALIALRASKRFEGELAEVLTHFRRVAGNDRAPIALRRLAVELLGELRDGDGVTMLVDTLGDPDSDLSSISRDALKRITKQDFGGTTASWQGWLTSHGDEHRVEWLIDALLHDDETFRREAGDELKVATKEFFGFQAALPKKEREVVHRKYRKWWETIGRSRFLRA